jgi:glutamate formiminotransferase
MAAIIECVPNISEGRDLEKIETIVSSARNISGCSVLGVEPDADYNRTVITIAGSPESVQQAAYNLIKSAIENIDMSVQKGEHPRLGAVDVCPFIPLEGVSMEECSQYARVLAAKIAKECSVPTFLYGYAATHEDRTLLSKLRKEEYEGLVMRFTDGETSHTEITRYPDYGPRIWNDNVKKTGGITIGARDILVAYNVNVDEKDGVVSKKIGSLVRSSGRLVKGKDGKRMRIPGILDKVQGMGVTLESHEISQVSMNLLDIDSCPLHIAFEACKTLANDHGVGLIGSELVGLVPLKAMLDAGRWYNADNTKTDEVSLVKSAVVGLGLESLEVFDSKRRIIEWAIRGE